MEADTKTLEATESRSSKFEKCLKMIQQAENDNQRFAALLTVTQMKDSGLLQKDYYQLYQVIGAKFLVRLLSSKTVPEGCPEGMYTSVAVSIMSVLCTNVTVARELLSPKLLKLVCKVIESKVSDGEEDLLHTSIQDSYTVLSSLTSSPQDMEQLIRGGVVNSLVKAIIQQGQGWDTATGILTSLLVTMGTQAWEADEDNVHYTQLMAHYTSIFTGTVEQSKFLLCSKMSLILTTTPMAVKEDRKNQLWLSPLVKDLEKIFSSKLGSQQRDPALMLTASLLHHFGVDVVLPPFVADVKMLLTLTHIACIEVRMILENLSMSEIREKSNVLGSCYNILEDIIGSLTSASSIPLDQTRLIQLHSALTGAYNAILGFVSELSQQDNKEPDAVVIATVRVLCAWLAEETSALRKETYAVLPFLLHLGAKHVEALRCPDPVSIDIKTVTESCDQCGHDNLHTQHKKAGATNTAPSEKSAGDNANIVVAMQQCDLDLDAQNKDGDPDQKGPADQGANNEPKVDDVPMCASNDKNKNTFSDCQNVRCSSHGNVGCHSNRSVWLLGDYVRFLLPGLCHLSAEDESREIMLSTQSHVWLLDYFKFLLEEILQKRGDIDKNAGSLYVLCGILLNLIVMETELSTNDSNFQTLCHVIIENITQVGSQPELVILWANMVTLALFLVRNQASANSTTTEERNVFFTSTMRFVQLPVSLKVQGHSEALVLPPLLASVWEDVSELWHLSVHVLCESIPLYKEEITDLAIKNGHIAYFIEVLTKVKGQPSPEGMLNDLMTFVTEMTKFASPVEQQVFKKDCLHLAKIYKANHLRSIFK